MRYQGSLPLSLARCSYAFGLYKVLVNRCAQVRQIETAEYAVPVCVVALGLVEKPLPLRLKGVFLIPMLSICPLLQFPAHHEHALVEPVRFRVLGQEVPPRAALQKPLYALTCLSPAGNLFDKARVLP